jgi:hypothetical protein
MKRLLVVLFALCLAASVANADAGCGLIFGSDWAFAFSAPARWVTQCRAEQAGAAVTLWPQGTLTAAAPAMMYVTVNAKNGLSLALFAADAQQRLRSGKPNLAVRFVPGMSVAGRAALVFRETDARNHELVAYVEGPTRFFVVAISARNAKALEDNQGAFKTLLASFVPMKVTTQ